MKKVLVITHRIGENYGGIMQAYALQSTLKSIGYDAVTTYAPKQGLLRLYLKYVIKIVLHVVHKKISNISPNLQQRIATNTQEFISQHITMAPFASVRNRNVLQEFAAIVVGSDQVWRAKFANIRANGLEFASDYKGRKLSYAASFGTDSLEEYSTTQCDYFGRLLHEFDSISVRESSAIDIVKQQWSLDAMQHIDPTLLISPEQYLLLTKGESVHSVSNAVFTYILDKNETKRVVTDKVTSILNKDAVYFMPEQTTSKKELLGNLENFTLPRVEEWISGFANASYIVTDSFHGCVFAIIFNKPFVAIANTERGVARFTSLLDTFGLSDRLVFSEEEVNEQLVTHPISWSDVNERIIKEQKKSIKYLRDQIGVSYE